MNTTRILIERVLCDTLTGPGNPFERPTIDSENQARRDALGEFSRHYSGLLQTLEVRLTTGPYDPSPDRFDVAGWSSDDPDATLARAIIRLCHHHYGSTGASYAGHVLRCMGMRAFACRHCVQEHGENPNDWLTQWPEGAPWRDDFHAHLCESCYADRCDAHVAGLPGRAWCEAED